MKNLVGSVVQFYYPKKNSLLARPELETRRVWAKSIRNLRDEPLDELTVQFRPGLQRGEWLLTGLDLGKQSERSFYLAAADSVEILPAEFRIGLFDPTGEHPTEFFSSVWGPSEADQRAIGRLIAKHGPFFARRGLRLGIFPAAVCDTE